MKPCDSWRKTRLCCTCHEPLTKGQWRREGKHMVTARTVMVHPQGGNIIGESLLNQPAHEACADRLRRGIEDLVELVEATERARWN